MDTSVFGKDGGSEKARNVSRRKVKTPTLRIKIPLPRALARRFQHDEQGVAAVEFALAATPFFVFLFACFESAAVFFSTSTLDNAVTEASRQIMTGEAQSQNMSAAEFKQTICDRIDLLLDCSRLLVDVRTFENFGDANSNDPIDDDGNLQVAENFNPGDGGDAVLVSVYYRYELTIPNLTYAFANMGT
ncbi:MAG: TadE/TadG family type IV pilus assembly protein, partial [Pseudomonadota bacterium]